MKPIVFAAASLLGLGAAIAQEPVDFRTEQILLAPRSLSCSPGDSLFVDGLVTCMAADRSEPYSRYLYLELIGDNDSVYVRQKLSCADHGRFSTAVLTEPDMPKGVYYLRGYTTYMRNFSPTAFAQQPVAVGIPIAAPDFAVDDDIACALIATGSRLIPDKPQRLTAILTNYAGFPLGGRTLVLTDNNGDTVATAVTSHSGYTSFDFVPKSKKSYSVSFNDEGIAKSFPAPEVDRNAARIEAAVTGKKLMFQLSDGAMAHKDRRLYLFDRNNGISEIMKPDRSGAINLANEPTSPVTLFLTDSNLGIITETSVLPMGHRRQASLSVQPQVKAGESLRFDLSGVDTAGCTVMARVVPDNQLWTAGAEKSMVFDSDFLSMQPFPTYSADGTIDPTEIAAWLASARFARFDLREAVENDSTFYVYYPEFNMSISGSVFDDANNLHHMKKGRIVAFNNRTNAVSDSLFTDGRFTLDVNDFAEGDAFFLQTVKGKKNDPVNSGIVLDDISFPAPYVNRRLKLMRQRYNAGEKSIDEAHSLDNRELPNVTVKARVEQKAQVSSKAHYEVKMKDRETIERRQYGTLLDILNDMPMITVIAPNPGSSIPNKPGGADGPTGWTITSKRGSSVLGKITENPGMALVVDGTKLDPELYDIYMYLPASDIESVEQLSIAESVFYAKTLDGAIIVKTRKWSPDKEIKSKGSIVRPMGLSNITLSETSKTIAPKSDGNYRIIVDIIGPDGITSLSRPITVKGANNAIQ